MNRLDYIVLLATIIAIPVYGLWRTYDHPSLRQYLKVRTLTLNASAFNAFGQLAMAAFLRGLLLGQFFLRGQFHERQKTPAVRMIEGERLDDGQILDGRPGQTRDVRLDDALGVGGDARAPWEQQGDQQRAAGPTHDFLYRISGVELLTLRDAGR